MKARTLASHFTVFALSLLGLGNSGCAPEEPLGNSEKVRFVIGLSPFFEKEEKDTVYRKVAALVLEDMPLNSSLWVYDAYRIRTVTQIDIPNVRAFRSSKTRANQFNKEIRAVKQFLATEHPRPEFPNLDFDRAVRFPQFMKFLGENVATDRKTTVIVLGSPLHIDEKEPGFSMVNGYFPSDGHVLASEEESVFGTKGRPECLRDFIVHFGFFGDPWISEIHHEKIDRFWTLFVKSQGGRLATLCGDMPTLFGAARRDSDGSGIRDTRHGIEPENSKIEMLRISREIGNSDWITSDVPANVQHGPPSRTVGRMKIGIRWRPDIDLDLYSKPKVSSEVLYFQHARSPEGYYFKDHRSSPNREYEYIEFDVPVNVWEVEAMINFYEGSLPSGPEGEVRIEFDRRIYVGRFSIRSRQGNQGRSGRGHSSNWTEVDIPRILNLR